MSDHVHVTQNAPRHLPVYSVLHALAISLVDASDSWTHDGVDRRIFRNVRAAFDLSIAKKDFEEVEKSGLVN